ncbi:hypothetical protein PILCRDRAFT_452139 [Piloderma croceum F 1598]|uniref:Uncharacterized protein n=1 Tax=Piloderma croceum (strain F 1598) TaxID=765440 RepID=A0A0C3FFA8_PILCF|nr:hypothetical protein PILCRDRAFT_452139 [Piloderma croceum F 1598]
MYVEGLRTRSHGYNADSYSIIRRGRGAVMISANKNFQLSNAFVISASSRATKVSKYS